MVANGMNCYEEIVPDMGRDNVNEEMHVPLILITGVSTGIGRASAELFANRGWTVVGTVRDPERRPPGLGSAIRLEALDLDVAGSAKALAERVLSDHGCPDALLNNAGMLQFGSIEDTTGAELERIFRVNVLSQFELIRGLLPSMRKRGCGIIANVTSLGGTMTFPFFSAYNGTKWALEGMTEGLWHELKPFGIRVKAIEPGFVETAIWDKVLPADGQEVSGGEAYRPFLQAMRSFETSITDRTTPDQAAEEVYAALVDDSDRLRYPVAAYAMPIVFARRVMGPQFMMRFFHGRWMGPDAK